MIVKHLDECKGTSAEVNAENGNWTSFRFLLAKDGMGYSMHETHIHPNTETHMCYRNHLEAVYCVGGAGEIEETKDGQVHQIFPGTLYALNEHDDHKLRAGPEGMRMVCVFNPPVTGEEKHDASGAYPAPNDGA